MISFHTNYEKILKGLLECKNKNDGIQLTVSNKTIVIDLDIVPFFYKASWSLSVQNFLQANINHKTVNLHKIVLGVDKGHFIEFVNGNRFDYRKSNLRLKSLDEGLGNRLLTKNKLGLKGIYPNGTSSYKVEICKKNKRHYFGSYKQIGTAIEVVNTANKLLYGANAKQI